VEKFGSFLCVVSARRQNLFLRKSLLGDLGEGLQGRFEAQAFEEASGCSAACAPSGLGCFGQEKQLSLGSVPSTGSTEKKQTRDDCGGTQSPGHCLLHLARRNLLPQPGARLLRSPEPQRPAQALNTHLYSGSYDLFVTQRNHWIYLRGAPRLNETSHKRNPD